MAGIKTRWHERNLRLPVEPFVRPEDPLPSISGIGTVGETLTADASSIVGDPDPVIAYQWRRDTVDLVGETSSTYVLVAGDAGTTVDCRITATNAQGTDSWTTNGIAVA